MKIYNCVEKDLNSTFLGGITLQPERRCTYCNTPMRRTAVRRAPRSGKVVLQVFSCGCKNAGYLLKLTEMDRKRGFIEMENRLIHHKIGNYIFQEKGS